MMFCDRYELFDLASFRLSVTLFAYCILPEW